MQSTVIHTDHEPRWRRRRLVNSDMEAAGSLTGGLIAAMCLCGIPMIIAGLCLMHYFDGTVRTVGIVFVGLSVMLLVGGIVMIILICAGCFNTEDWAARMRRVSTSKTIVVSQQAAPAPSVVAPVTVLNNVNSQPPCPAQPTQPAVQYAAQPQPMPQMAQPMVQPMAQPMVQPMAQPMVQPMAQPMAQPMVQPMAQPMVQPTYMTQPMPQQPPPYPTF